MNDTKQPRSFWPIGIIAFFALALVFLVTFVIWASRQREDLVAQNYYDNEVRFQKQLDQMNRTQPLASQVAVAYDAVLRNIVITLPAAQAVNAVGQIKLYRPSDAALDRSVPLAVNNNGVQQLDAKSLPAGLWKIRVQWSVDGDEYFLDRSVVVANQTTKRAGEYQVGRARHSVRAAPGQTDDGSHGVTRPTLAFCVIRG
jgi:hypothetical protein